MENRIFNEKLFSAFRVVAIEGSDENVFLSDETLKETVEVNDILIKSYGISLKPVDIVKVAKNNYAIKLLDLFNTEIFFQANKMKDFKAMYNPEQARSLDQTQKRLHQIMHYTSTYGLEALYDLFGKHIEVSKGWLPTDAGLIEDVEPSLVDDALLDILYFDVLYKNEVYPYIYKAIVSKRNRATLIETELLKQAAPYLSKEDLLSIKVKFKENLPMIISNVIDCYPNEEKVNIIHSLCQNTNDVLRCIKNFLDINSWHLKTSQKRMFVKALESYNTNDLKDNLILSNKKREDNLVLLNYLDYNKYSRSDKHKEIVDKLRDDDLKSFEAKLKKALKTDKQEALNIIKTRPGVMIRMMNFLLKNGIDKKDIFNTLSQNIEKLSLQTLLENAQSFSNDNIKDNLKDNQETLIDITKTLIEKKLSLKDTSIRNKKVYLDQGQFDLKHSRIMFNSKSSASDYISSGLAYKLDLDDVRYIRLFVSWGNGKKPSVSNQFNETYHKTYDSRVDIDCHAFYLDKMGNFNHVGWNSDLEDKKAGIYFSGDITTSPGVEFIDIDVLNSSVDVLLFSFHCYTGQDFANINDLRCGLLAVSDLGIKADSKLYDQKNCLYSHHLENKKVYSMGYCYLNMSDRYLYYLGNENKEFNYGFSSNDYPDDDLKVFYSARDYLDVLFKVQNVTEVNNKDDADVILTLLKARDEKGLSLIDHNWFADAE